jgi:hypothetical protein
MYSENTIKNEDIETLDINQLHTHHVSALLVLLGTHYLRNGDNRFMPTEKSVFLKERGGNNVPPSF